MSVPTLIQMATALATTSSVSLSVIGVGWIQSAIVKHTEWPVDFNLNHITIDELTGDKRVCLYTLLFFRVSYFSTYIEFPDHIFIFIHSRSYKHISYLIGTEYPQTLIVSQLPSPPQTTDRAGGLSTGTKAGIGAGVGIRALILGLLVYIVLLLRRRRDTEIDVPLDRASEIPEVAPGLTN